jgi:hypothetical protein
MREGCDQVARKLAAFASFLKRTTALALRLKVKATCRQLLLLGGFGMRKKVEVCPFLYIGHVLVEGVDLAWKGCGISHKRSRTSFFQT